MLCLETNKPDKHCLVLYCIMILEQGLKTFTHMLNSSNAVTIDHSSFSL